MHAAQILRDLAGIFCPGSAVLTMLPGFLLNPPLGFRHCSLLLVPLAGQFGTDAGLLHDLVLLCDGAGFGAWRLRTCHR